MYLFCNIKASGTDYKWCDILELNALITTSDFQIVGEFNEFAAPESKKYWSKQAEKIHGISYRRAIKFQNIKIVNNKFRDFIRPFSEKNIKFISSNRFFAAYLFLWWSNMRNGSHHEIQNYLKEKNIINLSKNEYGHIENVRELFLKYTQQGQDDNELFKSE